MCLRMLIGARLYQQGIHWLQQSVDFITVIGEYRDKCSSFYRRGFPFDTLFV